ncbi:hypothetical protein FACS1894139_09260 [Planctomycetales bacterium]|nr:hypothetical protein FACS1894107_07340 [Planctomycetales bacterium]GHT05441.1 hypothetical protein FACS1894139_09260 [Planctomycetales bacterium]
MLLPKFLQRILAKRKQKRTFREYGYEVKRFPVEGFGTVEYAQWSHPAESAKSVTIDGVNFYRQFVHAGEMAIDIGAHTGDTTVPMALATGKSGLTVAFEPNKYVHKILAKNATLNPDKTRIDAYCLATTAEDGQFEFNYSDASFCNGGFLSQIKQHRKATRGHAYKLHVTGVNLEKFLREKYAAALPRLRLIKIDTEGYDKEIVKSIPHLLRDYRPHLLVECYKRLTGAERFDLYDTLVGGGV